MSILATKKYNYKTILVYLAITVFTLLVDKVYSIFGHGVTSGYMTWMFLYPLLGGALYYYLVGLLLPNTNTMVGYRLYYNIHNSGISLLTVGSFAQGIFEIAGTNSSYVKYYFVAGGLFVAIGLVLALYITKHQFLNKKQVPN